MDDVRLQGVHDLRDLIADEWGAIGVGERAAHPVVRDLDDRQPGMKSPCHVAVPPGRVVIGAEDRDVMPRRLRTTELQRVDLRAGLVPGKEIVNRVKNPETGGHRDLIYRPSARLRYTAGRGTSFAAGGVRACERDQIRSFCAPPGTTPMQIVKFGTGDVVRVRQRAWRIREV